MYASRSPASGRAAFLSFLPSRCLLELGETFFPLPFAFFTPAFLSFPLSFPFVRAPFLSFRVPVAFVRASFLFFRVPFPFLREGKSFGNVSGNFVRPATSVRPGVGGWRIQSGWGWNERFFPGAATTRFRFVNAKKHRAPSAWMSVTGHGEKWRVAGYCPSNCARTAVSPGTESAAGPPASSRSTGRPSSHTGFHRRSGPGPSHPRRPSPGSGGSFAP